MPEAKLEQAGNGLTPVSDGWFVLNARDAETTSGKEAYAPYGHWVNDGESPL